MGPGGRAVRSASLLAVGILASAAPAAATPEVSPTEPAPAPPATTAPAPSGIGNPLAQAGSAPAGPFGLPDLAGYAPNLILGQNPVPAAPGAPDQPALPNLSAFNPEYLLAQNEDPAQPGQGEPAPGLGPTPDDPGTGRIAFLRRLHEMYQSGTLDGALLGQTPLDELGRPLLAAPAEDPPGAPPAG